MTILEVEVKPVESALQQRLHRIPAGQRAAVTGSFRLVFGRPIYAFDVAPLQSADQDRQSRGQANVLS